MNKYLKKIFTNLGIVVLIACVFLTGCSQNNTELETDTLVPMEQASYTDYETIIPYGTGLYYVNDYELYYSDLSEGTSTKVGDLEFSEDSYYESIDYLPIYCYSEHLLYVSSYHNSEGEICMKLCMSDSDLSHRKDLFEFSYQPILFLVNDGYVITGEYGEQGTLLHVQDLNGKETAVFNLSGVWHLFADQEYVYFTETNDPEGSKVCRIDLTTMQMEEVLSSVQMQFENQSKAAVYQMDQTDGKDALLSWITDLDDHEILFNVKDEMINYFDETYIYTSTVKDTVETYHIYDWSGSFIRSIQPSEVLQMDNTEPVNNMHWTSSDCSQILRIVCGNIIGNTMQNEEVKYFSCEIETGACRYLKSEK